MVDLLDEMKVVTMVEEMAACWADKTDVRKVYQ